MPDSFWLVFHCIKLFDGIQDLATRKEKGGWVESDATLKFAVNILQVWIFQNLFCFGAGVLSLIVILHSGEQWQKNQCLLSWTPNATSKKPTQHHSRMIYWQVSTCLLSITQSIILSQLDLLKLLGICSFLVASYTFTSQLKFQFPLPAIFKRITAGTSAKIFLLKTTAVLDCTHKN